MPRSVHKSLYNKLKAEIAMITGIREGNQSALQYWYQNHVIAPYGEADESSRCSECEASLIPKRQGFLPEHERNCPIRRHFLAIDMRNGRR